MSQSRIKLVYRTLIVVVFIYAISTIVVNTILTVSLKRFLASKQTILSHKIRIGRAKYIFPGRVVIKDFALSKNDDFSKEETIFLPTITVNISALSSLFKRHVVVTDIIARDTHIAWAYFCVFIGEHWEEIIEFIKSLPKEDVQIRLENTMFELVPKGYGPDYAILDFNFRLKGDAIFVDGVLGKNLDPVKATKDIPAHLSKQPLLKYGFRGYLHPDGFSFDDLMLSGQHLYSKLWGDFTAKQLEVNGFSFLNTRAMAPQDRKNREAPLNIIERVKFFLRVLKGGTPPVDELSERNIYLLDINVVADMDFPRVTLKKFGFTFNKAPVNIRGGLVLSQGIDFDLIFSFYPVLSKTKDSGKLERADFKVTGELANDTFQIDGEMEMAFQSREGQVPLQRVKVNFEDFLFDFKDYPKFRTGLNMGAVSWWTNYNEHRISVGNVAASIDFGKDTVKYIEAKSDFYEGTLDGKVWIDTSQLPFRITGEGMIKDADPNKLQEFLVHFSKVRGKLDGVVAFENYPRLNVNGKMELRDGNVRNFEFFKWLAESFDLPSLVSVDFYQATTNFGYNVDRVSLSDINLESRNVKIKGYYNVDKDELVSSKISMFFSDDLLRPSSKSRVLLKFFAPEVDFVDFDFQLSGDQDSLNFQWLPSASKQRIQNGIPDFIERIIERRVEGGLESEQPSSKPVK